MTIQPTITPMAGLPLTAKVRLEEDRPQRWPRHVRLSLFLGAASLSWAVLIAAVYYAVELAQRIF